MRVIFTLFISLTLWTACQTETLEKAQNSVAKNVTDLSLIPEVQEIEMKEGIFELSKQTPVYHSSKMENSLLKTLQSFFPFEKTENISEPSSNHKGLCLILTDDTLNKEAYQLNINPQQIVIKSGGNAGLFYGLQTLRQMLPDTLSPQKIYSLACLEIKDKPAFKWRGAHLDVGRHFYPKSFVKKYIDLLAKHKMNIFHWHLTEDQGWRIEIKAFPKLTEISSKRKETIVKQNFDPYIGDGKEHKGFYTQNEVKEIVAYAKERFVTVVPEIELPGHSLAVLAAYPQLSCKGDSVEVGTRWGVYDDVYCAGNDSVFNFLQTVLDEVVTLFSSKYIHIGGDECPKTRWKTCSKCQKRIKNHNLKDEHELQSYFVQRIEKYLLTKGRNIIGWDEILEGGLAPNATVMSWRGESGGIEAARQNHNVVMSPNSPCYFDHYQSKDKDNEPLAIGGYSPLKMVFEYQVLPKDLPADKQQYILGAQANIWTEYMPDSDHVEYMAYPRLSALSEAVWTNKKDRNYDNFIKRMQRHYKRLDSWNVHYRPHKDND